jgi:RyR domain
MPGSFDDCTRETLARAIHEEYVARVIEGQDPAGGREGPVAHAAYDDLPEEARESNRRQVDDIRVKLELIGATIVPLADLCAGDPLFGEFRFTPRELERLSRHEHARWMREKRRAGWRFGPAIDAVARTHPCLVGYDRLPSEEREKDRQVVERIPPLLRAVGLGIARRGVPRDSKPKPQETKEPDGM